MTFFKERLKTIKAFIFDVDGVLSTDTSPLDDNGDPVRTANVKDGFAIRYAMKNGFQVGIITGADTQRVKLRYQKLGVAHIYLNASDKSKCLDEISTLTGLKKSEMLFMGDDLPDYSVMREVGIATCPADAVPEIKAIADYISSKKGGEGCARDIIEQTLRAQQKWIATQHADIQSK